MNTTQKGDKLELAIFNLFKKEIEEDRFPARKENCQIFWRKGYYSKARESDIIFDVSIEIGYPGEHYSILWLIECKNYSDPVPVSDVEEFFAKASQVGPANTKAIVISSSELQEGALTYSRSMGMGVARYFDPGELKWELRRSASIGFMSAAITEEIEIRAGLINPGYRSSVYELYMQSPSRKTNVLSEFLQDLMLHGTSERELGGLFRKPVRTQTNAVRYLSTEEIERQAQVALGATTTVSGHIDLNELCARLHETKGLRVERVPVVAEGHSHSMLARISFEPLVIQLFPTAAGNSGRDRFTLAHELGHLLLGHGAYLRSEQHDESDQSYAPRGLDDGSDVKRMEYQANYFASCLLMPKEPFVATCLQELARLGLRNKGFGPLYVDAQQCNLDNYYSVTNRLMMAFGTSRAAAAIRLRGLGLLHDARTEFD